MRKIWVLALACLFLLPSCQENALLEQDLSESGNFSSEDDPASSNAGFSNMVYTDLIFGQNTKIGQVEVAQADGQLRVSITTWGEWFIQETHVYAGTDADLPRNGAGNPQVGHFPYKSKHNPYVQKKTFLIPSGSFDPCIVVAAHASVVRLGTASKTTVLQSGSAWGKGDRINPQGNWAMKFGYCFEGIDLESGLIAHYAFSGNTADSSGNGHHGRFIASGSTPSLVADRFGNPNSAYFFDGNDYIQVADAPALRLANTDYTISAWTYITGPGYSADNTILSKRGGCANNGWMYHIIDNQHSTETTNTVIFNLSGCDDPHVVSPSALSYGTWNHTVMVYSGNVMSMYINGVQVLSEVMPSPNAYTTANMSIGRDNYTAAFSNSHYFNGTIDDIRIYGRALTPAEVRALGQ
jgi:hypothetical protein